MIAKDLAPPATLFLRDHELTALVATKILRSGYGFGSASGTIGPMKRLIGLDRKRWAQSAPRRARVLPMLCVTVVFALAACSGGGTATSTQHHRVSPSASTDPATGPAAAAAVKAMWQRFFNGAVPISSRLQLLQDGSAFASFVRSQAKTSIGSLILAASATVSSVTLQPPDQANVIFTVLIGGKPLEKDLHGTAVYLAGHWKVAVTSFCSLLRQVYGKTSHVIPAACGG